MPNNPIIIGADGRCQCDCVTTCPLGRMGMQVRCTAAELVSAGIPIEHLPQKSVSSDPIPKPPTLRKIRIMDGDKELMSVKLPIDKMPETPLMLGLFLEGLAGVVKNATFVPV